MDFITSENARHFLTKYPVSEETLKSPESVREACYNLFCGFTAATTHLGNLNSETLDVIKDKKDAIKLEEYIQKIDGKIINLNKLIHYKTLSRASLLERTIKKRANIGVFQS